MPDERSKYDTDPLDPDFVRHTEEIGGRTRDVGRTREEEARHYEGADAPTQLFIDEREPLTIPPPIFAATALQTQSHTPRSASTATQQEAPRATTTLHDQPPSARVVPGVGVPENLLVVACYAPLFLGAIAALVELLLVPRDERRVRFHAAQGLALHGAVLAGALLLRAARFLAMLTFGGLASGLLWVVWLLFFIATIVFFVQAMMRVWRGEPMRVEALSEATRWLDEQIAPRT